MTGAIAMSGAAALRSGTGLVSACIPGSARPAMYKYSLEQMCVTCGKENCESLDESAIPLFIDALNGKTAIAIGPGMGTSPATENFLNAVLPHIKIPFVLDADGLNMLAKNPSWWKELKGKAILTPHPGEMKRLTGDENVNNFRLEAAEKLARDKDVIIVLKGAGTVVALPSGETWINPTGNSGMATGGAGDVLTGMISGMLAAGYGMKEASLLGVYLHGLAGDILAEESGTDSVTAEGIISKMGPAFLRALEGNHRDIQSI